MTVHTYVVLLRDVARNSGRSRRLNVRACHEQSESTRLLRSQANVLAAWEVQARSADEAVAMVCAGAARDAHAKVAMNAHLAVRHLPVGREAEL